MQTPKPTVSTVKANFRAAVMARKKADQAAIKARGAEVLAFVRQNAKRDLEALEATFMANHDVEAIVAQIQMPPADDEENL